MIVNLLITLGLANDFDDGNCVARMAHDCELLDYSSHA